MQPFPMEQGYRYSQIMSFCEADEPDDKPAKKTHRALKITAAICGAVVVCTYIVISIWFMFHYNYKTYINDIDYSFYSLDDVDAYIESYPYRIIPSHSSSGAVRNMS